jgi:AraC-like DNA-binding protein
MAPRAIDDSEFVWMLRGEASFVTGGEVVRLSPGLLLLVPPGPRHSFVWDERRASRHGYVHFRPEEVAGRTVAGVRLRRMTERDPMAGLCAYLLWLGRERPDGWEAWSERTLGALLSVFTTGPLPGDEAPSVLPIPLSAALDHLRHGWSEMPLRRITVAELADAAHVSRSYLNRLFRGAFGTGVTTGLERLRCLRAETLLTRTDMTIGSIAELCGFADLYHFSHRFTRLHGVPPSVYRRGGGADASMLDQPGTRRLANALWP